MLLGPRYSEKGGRQLGGVSAKQNQDDLIFLRELLESGRVVPLIDKRYPLKETAEAVRYLGTGHARAKVIVTMSDGSQ
jgi:NADPH:quinone reductase-like Zn-dependent oxidoreductase